MLFGVINKTFIYCVLFIFLGLLTVNCQSNEKYVQDTVEQCQEFIDQDEIIKANKCYAKAIIFRPSTVDALSEIREKKFLDKCFELRYKKDLYARAIECYIVMSKLTPNNSLVHRRLASSYRLFNKRIPTDKEALYLAEESIKTAVKLEPNSAVNYGTYGKILEQKEDFVGAFEKYKQATTLAPNDYVYWLFTALLQRKLGKHKDSIESYTKAHELKPDDTITLYLIGVAYERIKEIDNAIIYLEKLQKIDPKYDDVKERLDALKEAKRTGVLHTFRENMKPPSRPKLKLAPVPNN